MSDVNLNTYFGIGLDNEDEPIVDDVVINTVRTPPNTKSTGFNRVIFEIPAIGLLTRDSSLVVQPVQSTASGNTSSNVALNVVNGVLGCVKRCTLKIDGKELTNIENPSQLETNRMYSQNSPARMADYQRSVLGVAFETMNLRRNFEAGVELYKSENSPTCISTHGNFVQKGNTFSKTKSSNTKYSVPLHMLGLNFLRHEMLPLHLLQGRNIQLEVEFDSDCRNWAWCSDEALVAGDISVNLDSCELVTTHVQQNEELEAELKRDLMESSRTYDLLETYLIKQSMVNKTVGTQTNSLVRLNLQGRELQKIMQCQTSTTNGDGVNICAKQGSVSLGDVDYNQRSNGVFLYDRRISNNAQQFYLNSLYNNDRGLKVSSNAWSQTALQSNGQLVSSGVDFTDWCGRFNYLGTSYRNGNDSVFGGGVRQSTALEIHFDSKAAKAASPAQEGEHDLNFFVSVSKRLEIRADGVSMTF